MSFQKAADLLRLAELATVRYAGVSLVEIEAEWNAGMISTLAGPDSRLNG